MSAIRLPKQFQATTIRIFPGFQIYYQRHSKLSSSGDQLRSPCKEVKLTQPLLSQRRLIIRVTAKCANHFTMPPTLVLELSLSEDNQASST